MNKITIFSKMSCFIAVFILSIATSWAQCEIPTLVSISEINQISAKVNWTASASAPSNGYEIEVRTAGAPGEAVGLVGLYSVIAGETNVVVTGLHPSTVYFVYVRSKCASEDSAWTSQVTFTTTVLEPPVALDAINIAAESFGARWNPSLGANQYEIRWSEDMGFTYDNVVVGNVVTKLIVGLDENTPYIYEVRARYNAGPWTDWSNPINVTTTFDYPAFATWTATGWTAQPSYFVDVVFDYDFNSAVDEFGTELEAQKVTVNPGKTIVIASGTSLRVKNAVINNGGSASNFIVESNANLYQNGDAQNTGAISVKRNSSLLYRLDYTMWSSPVAAQNLLAFSPLTTLNRFYSYNTLTNQFNVIPNVAGEAFVPGKGYLIRTPNNWIPYSSSVSGVRYNGEFKGVPNNGQINVPVTNGYNLVGNPYPTNIKAGSFLSINGTVVEPTVYFWRRLNDPIAGTTGSYYATWNVFGGTVTAVASTTSEAAPDGFIRPGQGFLAKVKSTSSTIKFVKQMKEQENFDNVFFKTEEPVVQHKVWLDLTSEEGAFSQSLIGFASDADNGADHNDGKYIGDSAFALTSLLDSSAYTIQAKALPFVNTAEFDLRFQTDVAGTYTINMSKSFGMFDAEVDPLLVDMLTNTTTNLRDAAYTFATEVGVFDTRFKITFVETALGTVDNAIDANSIVAINNNNVLNISAGSYTINSVEVYDLQGRRIYTTQNVDASTTSIPNLNAQQQIILVKIATDHGTVTKKVQF